MDNCGLTCVLFIWIGFLWPIIVSSFYLNIRKKQIIAKGKYFLLSTIGGYILLIGLNFLISFFARNFVEVNSDIDMKVLAFSTTAILFIPPVVFSHMSSKRIANENKEAKTDPQAD